MYYWQSGGWNNAREEYKVFDIDYDLNGNIKNIKRNKDDGNLLDNLTYTYDHNNNSNVLKIVEDVVTGSWSGIDFSDNGYHLTEEYEYDANGNMVQDKNKGITVEYNYLNLPETVSWTGDERKIEWMYDANGTKLRKTVFDADGEVMIVTDYANGYVYNMNSGDEYPQLSYFMFNEGRVVKTGSSFEYEYHVKDHLGNVRLTFKNNNGTAEVTGRNFYYPFGLTVTSNITGDENKYKYNSKEYENDNSLNWYHYGARYYDPALGRWHTMDPVDEFLSPYLYVGNNPVNFIDPDGAQAAWPWGDVVVIGYREPFDSFSARNNNAPNYGLPNPEPPKLDFVITKTEKLDPASTTSEFEKLTKVKSIADATSFVTNPFLTLSVAEEKHAIEFARKNWSKIIKIKKEYNGTIRGLKIVGGVATAISVYVDLQKGDGTQALIDVGILRWPIKWRCSICACNFRYGFGY